MDLAIIASHLAGDYLLQNDYLANGKKRSSWICTAHVLLYMSGFTILWWFGHLQLWQWMAIAIQHWVQDRTMFVTWWMKVSGQREFLQPPFAPWSVIVVDNSMHLVWIAVVLYLGKA
mgnify:CR=1 FL=1